MQNDAIHEPPLDDVSADDQSLADDTPTQEGDDQPKREMSERERRMAELVKQRYEQEGIDYEPAAEQDEDPEDDPEDPEADPAAAPEQDVAEQDAPDEDPDADDAPTNDLESLGYYRKPDGKLYTTVKVNGEEREVLADQVKAYLQKDLAGDWKLQQAADRERRLQEMEQQLSQREQQIQQSLSKQQPPSGMDAETARQQAKAVLEKIWDGDDDAAAEALTDFLQRSSTAGQDHDQLLEEAERRAMSALERREAEKTQAQWQESVKEGNTWLRSQHPEIYQDQMLFNLVNNETERMVQAQQSGDPEYANLSPRDIIARAADDVNRWRNGPKDTPEKSTAKDRQARKDGLKPMPKGQSRSPSPKQEQEVDTSPAAVIARMRQSRAVV